MKRILLLLIALVLSVTMLASCDALDLIIGGDTGSDTLPDNNGDDILPDDEGKEDENAPATYLYNAFTPDEQALFNDILELVIPFVPNNKYYVKDYSESYDDGTYEKGINFYTYGNTEEEFNAYKAMFADYTNDGTEVDEHGDTWYLFSKGEVYIDLAYYYYEGDYVIDLYAYVYAEDSTGGDTGEDSSFKYTDFTSAEKSTLVSFVGITIPFISNDEYYLEEYYDSYYEANSYNFYAIGNTNIAFQLYKAEYESKWSFVEEFEDTDGNLWYCYRNGNAYVEMSYYYYSDTEWQDYIIDVFVFRYSDVSGDNTEGSGGESEGGSGNTGSTENADVITNAGKGLPQDADGVYDVDFTQATNVKDVTDQGYYLDGCPTVGSPAVLVIPVQFSDVKAEKQGYSLETIENAFEKDGVTDYYSVYDYYYISSYGKLTLDVTVLDEWFTPQYESSYYLEATYDYYGDEVSIGDQLIMNEALAWLEPLMDLSAYDSDKNGIIDAVILVNTLDINSDSDFHWAYRYWNIYTDDEGYYYEYDGVSANDYMWMSCGFFHEDYDESGKVSYDNFDVLNTYTAIHEFGHVLGADDYYDTSYSAEEGPMAGCDVMDAMAGDHCAFSKFNYGWLTTSRLVVAEESVTLTLEKFSKAGDTIIIANNWDATLGAYQEYYIVAYYTNDGLNDNGFGYFDREGIVVYHVNASLCKEIYEGETYYDVYNNNTDPSDEYGTQDNLIEFVKSADDTFTYLVGDSLPTVTDDQGNTLCYTFTVDALTADSATLTFTKN